VLVSFFFFKNILLWGITYNAYSFHHRLEKYFVRTSNLEKGKGVYLPKSAL
tara:strand:+ start:1637 stop:1789 length:153 start_codon:yes stop_codon:yes gene_type:complete